MDKELMAQRLRQLFAESGKPVRTTCELIGISRKRYYGWLELRSMPSASSLIKIARYFGVSADWLLGLSDKRTY